MGEEHWRREGFQLIFNMKGAFIRSLVHAHSNHRG